MYENNNFAKLPNNIIFFCLFTHFSFDDLIQIRRVSKYFFRLYVKYNENYQNYFPLQRQVSFFPLPNEGRVNLADIVRHKKYFKVNNDLKHFISITNKCFEHVCYFSYDDRKLCLIPYKTIPYPIKECVCLMQKSPSLNLFIDVCDLPYNEYKLYILHSLYQINGKYKLVIYLDENEIFNEKYPLEAMDDKYMNYLYSFLNIPNKQRMSEITNHLSEDYICDIRLNNFNKSNKEHRLKIHLYNFDMSQKIGLTVNSIIIRSKNN